MKNKKRFIIAAVVSFLAGILLFIIGNFLPLIPNLPDNTIRIYFKVVYTLCFFITPLLGIIALIISFRSQTYLLRIISVGVIIILAIPVVIFVGHYIHRLLPYIYTPPAITSENLVVYKNCIEFVRKHDDYGNIMFNRWGWGRTGEGVLCDPRTSYGLEETIKYFSEDDIIKIKEIAQQLQRIKCHKYERNYNMVLFYTYARSFTMTPFLPAGPGVLYSLDGENPNIIDREIINDYKPYIKLGGNWYTSRKLILRGPRSDIPISTPKPLIDHSLRLNDVQLDDKPMENMSK